MRAQASSHDRHDREREVLRKLARVLAEEARGGVLGEALEALLECAKLEVGGAFTVDGTEVSLVAERGLAPMSASGSGDLRAGLKGVAERVTATRKPVRVLDLPASDLAPALRADLMARGFGALLAQPVKHQREVVGVMVLLAKDPAAFDRTAVSLLETAGHMLALAIERDRRGEREASYRDELVQTGNMAMLGVLTASVAHELRAKTVRIAAHLGEQARVVGDLAEGATDYTRPMVAELAELLAEMTVASGEMSALVEHLNAVGRRQLAPERVDLGVLAREGLAASKSELRRRGVALVEDYAADCFITARRDNLLRVVLNLVFNAVDACTSVTQPQPKVVVRTRQEGNRVVLSVDDSGPHIPEVELHRVFQPLYASRERGQRAGLALKICSDVVSADHGTIEVVNLNPCGVSFRMTMPRAVVVSVPCDPSQRPTEPPPDGDAEIHRVFVIDDDELFTRTLKRALRPHDVRSASTASEAEMALLDPTYTPHVVLCDVGLPGITGDILHARVAAQRPLVARRFVFVNGGSCNHSEAQYLQSSGCPTLQKPFTAQAIWDVVALVRPSWRAGPATVGPPVAPDTDWTTEPPAAAQAHRYSDLPTLPPGTVEPAI